MLLKSLKYILFIGLLVPSIAFGATWSTNFQDLTSSRALGTEYQNTTSVPVCLSIVVTDSVVHSAILYISSTTPSSSYPVAFAVVKVGATTAGFKQLTGCVPPNYYYSITTSDTLISWYEYSFDVSASSGSGTTTLSTIDNPTQDLFEAVFVFFISMFFIVWFFMNRFRLV